MKRMENLGEGVTEGETEVVEVSYKLDGLMDFGNLHFKVNSSEFQDPEMAQKILTNIAGALNRSTFSDSCFVIEGHASSEGDAAANLDLSRRRAQRIVTELKKMGVGLTHKFNKFYDCNVIFE